MINTMTPPVLWPALRRGWRHLQANRAERRMRRTTQLQVHGLSDRMLRDIGLYERLPRRPHIVPRGL